MSNNVCILVMDRDSWFARTDVIIICNPDKKLLYWLPRDLYCTRICNRLNTAYQKGQDTLVIECLNDVGIAIKHCICILPILINENIMKIGEINIPIGQTRRYFYPLHRHKPIEEGKRLITFTAPNEILTGDRIHEYIGARYAADDHFKPSIKIPSHYPDFDRIRRQQNLLKHLLITKYVFHYADEKNIRGVNESVIQILKMLDDSWQIETISETQYTLCVINKMSVLVKK